MQKLNLPGPKAQAMIARDAEVISPSYPRGYPFVMDHGKGTEVWDVDGNRFLDFAAGIAVVSTGHTNPAVVKAIQEQAEKFIHISSDFYHESWIRLAEKLSEIAPWKGPSCCFMTNSGTESVETAIKLARYNTGATQFIGFLGAFHGRTLGAVTFTASKARYKNGFFPLMNGVVHVPFPDPYRPVLTRRPGMGDGETVVAYLEEEILGRLIPDKDAAGILVEPIQGEGGYIVPPDDFFPALRALCDKYDIRLIADEVQSGMGRTGKWWAIEQFGVEPDMVLSAKGIASGMPLGVCMTKKEFMDWPHGSHGNTYGGNPISCSASLATIKLIEEQYLENTRVVGAYAKEGLQELAKKHVSIGDVRGMGFMLGVEFVMDRTTKAYAADLRDDVVDFAFERGLLTLGCGKSVIRITPPLSTSRTEVDEALIIFDEAISLAEHKHGLA
ncbi:MAG TPA: acetyl ornithine aminotransferase family protein [Anaerolineaceae bacterium]|nr:acetyl ornithine aminotransferase family protein [Anaerolineaceae bacterium]HPT24354.1 acetyl ornithine aminotransferase family protein [Anaerolineaceae bacterium]